VKNSLLDRYVAAQVEGDRRAALRIVLEDGPRSGVSVPDLYLGVIQAAQHRIGDLWQMNRISVSHEHLATAISQLAIAHLYPLMPRHASVERRVLVSCVDGELHDLGARMVADFFEMYGFDTRYLGASMPAESLVATVREDVPDLLVLSATMSTNLPALRATVAGIRDAVGDRIKLGVGGSAFHSAHGEASALGADVHGRDALESVVDACRVLAVATR